MIEQGFRSFLLEPEAADSVRSGSASFTSGQPLSEDEDEDLGLEPTWTWIELSSFGSVLGFSKFAVMLEADCFVVVGDDDVIMGDSGCADDVIDCEVTLLI